MRSVVGWKQAAALLGGAVALALMLAAVGWENLWRSAVRGGPSLPAAIGVHATQLLLAGAAWYEAIGRDWAAPAKLRARDVARVRWIREGVNTLLPVAQIGGQVVGVRLLVGAGLLPVRAVVGTVLDVALEAGSQLLVVLAAVALLLGTGQRGVDWVWFGLAGLAAAVLLIAAALRLGAARWVEAGLRRAAGRWPGLGGGWSLAGLEAALRERQADRGAMARGLLLNVASWGLGALEVWVILRALDVPTGLVACYVIESLAMAARSAGFAVPGAVGVQEGGFVLACGLFGIDAETALALSILKRVRELTVSAAALAAWPGFKRRSG